MVNKQNFRRVMKWLPGDEKREYLAQNGIFFLHEEINEATSYMTALDLFYLLFKQREDGSVKKPVWVILNSPGGYVHEGFAIYDSIVAAVESGIEINVVGLGTVASMATFIIQAGTRRYTFPYTQFLIHQISQTHFLTTEEVNEGKERVQELERINNVVMKKIAERCGIEVQKIMEISRKTDYWLGAEDARKFGDFGLVDEIITSFPFSLPIPRQ